MHKSKRLLILYAVAFFLSPTHAITLNEIKIIIVIFHIRNPS